MSTDYCNLTDIMSSYGNSIDVIWSIWESFFGTHHGVIYNVQEDYTNDFDQCVSMSAMVLNYGCEIEDSTPWNVSIASPLFSLPCYMLSKAPCSTTGKVLEYLINAGYDLEQQNHKGQTPLLYAARQQKSHILKCLRTFIRKGANCHAADPAGRGALHCALKPKKFTRALMPQFSHDEKLFLLSWLLKMENDTHVEDYNDDGFDSEPLICEKSEESWHIEHTWLRTYYPEFFRDF